MTDHLTDEWEDRFLTYRAVLAHGWIQIRVYRRFALFLWLVEIRELRATVPADEALPEPVAVVRRNGLTTLATTI